MSFIALAASVVLAQAATATGPSPTPAGKATEIAPITVTGKEKDPMVCKVSQPLGSKVPKRTCTKKSDADQARADARTDVEYMRQHTEPFYRTKEP